MAQPSPVAHASGHFQLAFEPNSPFRTPHQVFRATTVCSGGNTMFPILLLIDRSLLEPLGYRLDDSTVWFEGSTSLLSILGEMTFVVEVTVLRHSCVSSNHALCRHRINRLELRLRSDGIPSGGKCQLQVLRHVPGAKGQAWFVKPLAESALGGLPQVPDGETLKWFIFEGICLPTSPLESVEVSFYWTSIKTTSNTWTTWPIYSAMRIGQKAPYGQTYAIDQAEEIVPCDPSSAFPRRSKRSQKQTEN